MLYKSGLDAMLDFIDRVITDRGLCDACSGINQLHAALKLTEAETEEVKAYLRGCGYIVLEFSDQLLTELQFDDKVRWRTFRIPAFGKAGVPCVEVYRPANNSEPAVAIDMKSVRLKLEH